MRARKWLTAGSAYVATQRGWIETIRRIAVLIGRIIGRIIVPVGVALLLFYAAGLILLLRHSLSLARGLSEATGLDAKLIAALTGILVALLLWVFGHHSAFPARGFVRVAAKPIIAFYLIGGIFSGAQYFVSGRTYFDPKTGNPVKFCIKTLQGFRCSTAPGFDPELGVEYQPVTPELAEEMVMWRRTQQVKAPTHAEDVFFDPLRGKPVKWYYRLPSGEIEVFSLPGHHPKYGDVLRPVTK